MCVYCNKSFLISCFQNIQQILGYFAFFFSFFVKFLEAVQVMFCTFVLHISLGFGNEKMVLHLTVIYQLACKNGGR